MAIKFQVFISSTFGDLRSEREQVLKATLEMGHIPVGMEMFSAADEEQWKIIARQIEECDYYAVVVAHQYGSVVDGVSYTEKEYDYAVSRGVPVLGFVIEDAEPWPADRIENDPEKKEALEAFKNKVKRKLVGFWKNADDLHGKFSIALMKAINTNPRPGWARANEVAGPEVAKELSRLSRENADLRKELEIVRHEAEDDADAERRRIIQTMRHNNAEISFFYRDGKDWEDKNAVTLFDLFSLLAPQIVIEQTIEEIATYVGIMRRPNKMRDLRNDFPVPSNSVNHWISDLMALGVVEPSQKRHTVSDTKEYWSLTTKGRDVLTDIRRTRLEAFASAANAHDMSDTPNARVEAIAAGGLAPPEPSDGRGR